jgi:lysyl-tRNA synthetase class 2
MLQAGIDVYPIEVPRSISLEDLRSKFGQLEIDVATGEIESVTGRVIFRRDSGKLCFATIREGAGAQLQVMISLDKVGQEKLDQWKKS